MDQNDALSREMRDNIERLKKQHDGEIADMEEFCRRLEAQVNSYHAGLQTSMVDVSAR
eukprot:SAG31_NODE_14395_length_809_cov_1.398592_1_plen_58_part_00